MLVTLQIFLRFIWGQELLTEHKATCVQLRAGASQRALCLGTCLGAASQVGRGRRRLCDAVPLFVVRASLVLPLFGKLPLCL